MEKVTTPEQKKSQTNKIIQLLEKGYYDKRIATKLGISVRTLQYRKRELMKELQAKNAFQLGFMLGKDS